MLLKARVTLSNISLLDCLIDNTFCVTNLYYINRLLKYFLKVKLLHLRSFINNSALELLHACGCHKRCKNVVDNVDMSS